LPEAAASRLRKAPISPIVLISGAGNMIVEFLSTPITVASEEALAGAFGGTPRGAIRLVA
jgi:hypothetical protein